jgi:methylenetetrahydrofolate dehydrogenase (NADP+)/methenyltetrahydrofolate cyclohydrolase
LLLLPPAYNACHVRCAHQVTEAQLSLIKNKKGTMLLDGQKLAHEILRDLKNEVKALKKKKRTPQLAVVLIGSDAASLSFVRQKQKAAAEIGAMVSIHQFKKIPLYQKLAEFIKELNADSGVHGIIIQRPLPPSLSAESLTKMISRQKDVDGFLTKSEHLPPIGIAIFKVFNEIYYKQLYHKAKPVSDFTKPLLSWLKNKNIVIIGRGETGGKPIAETLQKQRLNFIMLNSNTDSREEYLKQADIIISAVGKSGIVNAHDIKPGAIIIGVGQNSW